MIATSVRTILLSLACLSILASCKNNAVTERPLPADSAYFSVKQFISDQVQMYKDQPYALTRVVNTEDRFDSGLIPMFEIEWAPIIKAFSDADISTRSMLGKYDFSVYDDATTGNRDYSYIAKDPGLFTRSFQIHSDPFNNKITSIYMETSSKNFWSGHSQKLLYVPLHIIQIQESSHKLLGSVKKSRTEIRFPQAESQE